MTPPATETKVLCPECRHENEPERIYCHECGTRLDRSAVRFKKEPLEDTHKRVKRMFNPTRAKLQAWLSATSKLICGAGAVAVIIAMFSPPELPPPTKSTVLASSIRFDLESMVTKHQPTQKQIDEEGANGFITSIVRSKRSALDHPLLQFKRAVVGFREGGCSITAERSLLNYWSVYTTCGLAPELKAGSLTAKIESGHIGRLPIHPKLAKFIAPLFKDIISIFDRDLQQVSKMKAIELHDKNLTITAPTP